MRKINYGKHGGISSKQNWKEFYGEEEYTRFVENVRNGKPGNPPVQRPTRIINPKDDPDEWEYMQWEKSQQYDDYT